MAIPAWSEPGGILGGGLWGGRPSMLEGWGGGGGHGGAWPKLLVEEGLEDGGVAEVILRAPQRCALAAAQRMHASATGRTRTSQATSGALPHCAGCFGPSCMHAVAVAPCRIGP